MRRIDVYAYQARTDGTVRDVLSFDKRESYFRIYGTIVVPDGAELYRRPNGATLLKVPSTAPGQPRALHVAEAVLAAKSGEHGLAWETQRRPLVATTGARA
jgi:hypothetical protein